MLKKEEYEGNLLKLHELYLKDRKAARVVYMSKPEDYKVDKKFEYDNGVKWIRVRVGVSVSHKWFQNWSMIEHLLISDKGVFHQLRNSQYIPISLGDITHENYDLVMKKFPQLEAIYKVAHELKAQSWDFTKNFKTAQVNWLLNHKITTLKKLYRMWYKVDSHKFGKFLYHAEVDRKEFTKMKWCLANTTDINEKFDQHMFKDTLDMAYKLGEKINSRWSVRRLTEEHDRMQNEIYFLLNGSDPQPLKIAKRFELLAERSGFEMARTNVALLFEGRKQRHCVGTADYSNKIERGECAIYFVEGFTLQVNRNIERIQFRGKGNASADFKLTNKVDKILNKHRAAILEDSKGSETPAMTAVIEDFHIDF